MVGFEQGLEEAFGGDNRKPGLWSLFIYRMIGVSSILFLCCILRTWILTMLRLLGCNSSQIFSLWPLIVMTKIVWNFPGYTGVKGPCSLAWDWCLGTCLLPAGKILFFCLHPSPINRGSLLPFSRECWIRCLSVVLDYFCSHCIAPSFGRFSNSEAWVGGGQYKNVRPDYLKNIWKVVNWKDVAHRYQSA